MSTTTTYYEETGYRLETIWLKKIFYTALTIYPFFTIISPILYSGNVFAVLAVLISILLYIIGCVKLNTLVTYSSIVVSVIVQKIFLNTFNPIVLLINTAWIFFSEYIVELFIKEKTFSNREFHSVSILYTLQVIAIPLIYIILTIIIANAINYTYEYIYSTAPKMLQVFYATIVETRIGAVLFTILILYLIHVFLNEYIYGLINDLFFSTKKYVLDYANKFISEEYENVVNMNDWFSKFYRRILLFIIAFTLFPLFYPLLELFEFKTTPLILVIVLNITVSFIIYYFIDKYLRKIIGIDMKLRISHSALLLKIFVVILIIYVSLMIVFSNINSLDIFATSIGLKQPVSMRSDLFSKTITSIYIGLTEAFYSISQKYVLYFTESYSVFIDLLEKLIKFMWG